MACPAPLRATWSLGLPKGDPAGLRGRKGLTGACRDQRALLLGQRGEQVQDEGINVGAKLGHQEGHLVGHQAADEVNVTAEAVQFSHGDVALLLSGECERCLELWPSVYGVRSLTCLDLNELPDKLEPLSLSELLEGLPLGVDARDLSVPAG